LYCRFIDGRRIDHRPFGGFLETLQFVHDIRIDFRPFGGFHKTLNAIPNWSDTRKNSDNKHRRKAIQDKTV
jgi:hypothetical protein